MKSDLLLGIISAWGRGTMVRQFRVDGIWSRCGGAAVALLLLLAAPAKAVNRDWSATPADQSWHNAANWSGTPAGVPAISTTDRAQNNRNDYINVTGDAECARLYIAFQSATAGSVVQQPGSTMTVSISAFVGYNNAGAHGYYYMDGGTFTTPQLVIGSTSGAQGTMAVTNATVGVSWATGQTSTVGGGDGSGLLYADNSHITFSGPFGLGVGGTGTTGEVVLVNNSSLLFSGNCYDWGNGAGSRAIVRATDSALTFSNYLRWHNLDMTLIDSSFTNNAQGINLGYGAGTTSTVSVTRGEFYVNSHVAMAVDATGEGHLQLIDTTATIGGVGHLQLGPGVASVTVNNSNLAVAYNIVDGAAGSTFEVVGTNGTITCGRFIFSSSTSTVRVSLDGTDGPGIILIECTSGNTSTIEGTLEVDVLSGFQCSVGDTFNVMKTLNGKLINNMTLVNLDSNFEFSQAKTNDGSNDYLTLTCTKADVAPRGTVIILK